MRGRGRERAHSHARHACAFAFLYLLSRCFANAYQQSCDEFLFPSPPAPPSGMMCSDGASGAVVAVEWCRHANCNFSRSPLCSPTDCSAGGCPVALIRDLIPAAHHSQHNSDGNQPSHDSDKTFEANGTGVITGEKTTVVVVPYRNRTNALALLVREKHCHYGGGV
jgi:hypothetical protein